MYTLYNRRKITAALAALALAGTTAGAQQAFNSLSFGVELGTTGVGVELAMPLVTDHMVFKLGFNAPSLSYGFSTTMPMDQVNATVDNINAQLQQLGLPEHIDTRMPDMELSLRPVLNLSTAKLMLEYYPFRKSSFHITAGAYFGMGDNFLSATLSADRAAWDSYTALRDEVDRLNAAYGGVEGYSEYSIGDIRYSLGDRSFEIAEQDGTGSFDAEILVRRVRPYLGLGFGRSVPKGHFGFQFDVGVWYHGAPVLSSSNEVAYDPSAEVLLDDISQLDELVLYPQVSLRLIYKIF